MPIDDRFGFIVLLDALGARTTDSEVSRRYLTELNGLKEKLASTKEWAALSEKNFRFRFFGDSVLMTYSIPEDSDETHIKNSLMAVLFISSKFMCDALEAGIPFRGALSIGKYLSNQERNVDLGPAITDAASWYDKGDLLGIMVTPHTTNYLKALYKVTSRSSSTQTEALGAGALVLYNVPLSKGYSGKIDRIETYMVNWTFVIPAYYSEPDISDWLLWFYYKIKSIQVPPGTETKYSNTEAFIRKSVGRVGQLSASLIEKGPGILLFMLLFAYSPSSTHLNIWL